MGQLRNPHPGEILKVEFLNEIAMSQNQLAHAIGVGERKEFAGMLDFAKAQNETVAVVADAVDRFQRSLKESVLIDELIRKEQVELHFCREGMVIGKGASSTDILRWDFSVMGAKAYVLNLSENVKRSLEYKWRNGEWGGKAPLGYKNVRDANDRSILVHDPERAFLVRMLFEDYAKGCFFISGDLVRMAREWGLKNKTREGGYLSTSQIQHILRNPFYYGAMRIKGRLYPHNYPPLIGQDLFDRCTKVQLGWTQATATRYSEKPFVFRGLETLIILASRAVELFERSKTEQKRQLIALVFSNLRLKEKS